MRFLSMKHMGFVLAGVLVCTIGADAQPALAPDDPDLIALVDARSSAEDFIASGDHAGAITVLLQSLRAAPGNRPELADAAYGNGQMISYVLLHLMPEPEAYAFAEKGFDADTHVTDKMVRTLCFIAIGLETNDKTALTRDAMYLTSSDNKLVRAITLYYLSNPYFYDNRDFTQQHADLLAAEHPELDLAQTALNLPLYAEREAGDFDATAEESGAKRMEAPPYKPWSSNLRVRIGECANNLADANKSKVSRGDALRPLLSGITQAWDWRERYFSLLLLKGEFSGAAGPELRAATRALAATAANTPDAVSARVELARALSSDCVDAPADEALRDETLALAQGILERGVTELTPERVLWETWIYGLRNCADNLANAGHVREAAEVYRGLIDRLPGSKIAVACEVALSGLALGDEAPRQIVTE